MMLDYRIYKLVHLIAIMALFLAFGAAIAAEKGKARWSAPLHGIALFVILLAGFAMLPALGIPGANGHGHLPGWVIAKVVIWILLGLSLVLAKRKPVRISLLVSFLILLGAAAGIWALWKP